MVKALTTDMGAAALKPSFREVINEDRKTHPPIWQQYMTKESTTEFFVESQEIGGFPDVPLIDEGDYMNFAKPDTGYATRVQPERRQLAFAITYQDKRYNRIQKVPRYSKKLSRAARRTVERIAAAPLNEGFVSTRLVADGQPLFSDSHVRLDGSTADNKGIVDLAMDTLESAITTFMLMTDNDGTPLVYEPKFLVVHPSNVMNARRILQSSNYFTVLSGANSADTGIKNIIKDMGLVLVSNPFLTDPDAWFLLADKGDQELMLLENEAMNDRDFDDPWTQDSIYSVQFSNIAYANSDIGVWGSTGG